MTIMKQLSVFVQNKVGTLHKLADELSRANTNILGTLLVDEKDWSVIRIVVDDIAKAKEALKRTGYVFGESDVLAFELSNSPGALSDLAGRLEKENVGIEFAYISAAGEKALMIMSTTNDKKAAKILK